MADENINSPVVAGGEKKNPLAALLLIVNALVLSVVAFLQFRSHQKEANQPLIQDVVKAQMLELQEDDGSKSGVGQKESEGILHQLDGFTANLAQGDGPRRYLRLEVVLKFSKDSKQDEFKVRQPQIRDVIISILNTKRPDDLLKVEGKLYLKEEIKSAINSFLIDGKVEDIYYVGFQVQ